MTNKTETNSVAHEASKARAELLETLVQAKFGFESELVFSVVPQGIP